jgi:hypothetical protein
MVPSFPSDEIGINYLLQTPDQTYPNLSISPTGGTNGWLGDFSPQWSDQSILYPASSDLVSPTSNTNGNGLATSYSMTTDMSYFPNFNSATFTEGNGNGNGINNGNGNGGSSGMNGDGNENGYDTAMAMAMRMGMGSGVDMDMSMALGLDRDGNGAVTMGHEQGEEWDVDFDAFVNNLGNTF